MTAPIIGTIAEKGAPILDVAGLRVAYRDRSGLRTVVHDIDFEVRAGEVVALVGESGSGKSSTAQALIGLLPEGGLLQQGTVRLNGENIAGWPQRRLDGIRGSVISLVPQDPGNSLNPVRTIGEQVAEILTVHGRASGAAARAKAVELLKRVGLSQPELRARQYPHELSGGMRQRVLIAIAIALKPSLIIADEPTSALDVTVQRHILDLIDDLRREYGTAVLLVTHDLGIAADRSDRLIVLQNGRIQEQGRTADILRNPQSSYTRRLLADAPSLNARPKRSPPHASVSAAPADDIIVVDRLVQDFGTGSDGGFRAVDDVSFHVRRGSTHAIVGESGSGKTTTIRIVSAFQRPTSGQVVIDGLDLSSLRGETLRLFRKKIQLVYQNPYGSLDPRQTIERIVEEPLLNFERLPRRERLAKVAATLEKVRLPADLLQRRPHALSGGQRQRVAIARALVLDPQILLLDEAVSALDVTVQAQILDLLDELQRELGLTYLFVSHDLAVVRQIADTVSVLNGGRLVETGGVEDVFSNPKSPYTRELIDAVPGKKFPRATDPTLVSAGLSS
ncbi:MULTISPECIES: dipeptide ABC transporter ATP-binding protein [Rhizobium]|uniref:ABC transporter ATP-binding protein n=1 Tax=Rhizobium tropici TaxID=398 RepID=A0A6P1CAU5_RHITR|nr:MULTISPECIES: ABC transporter ATP-binding protein [Rhizobium]AGB74215.1 putative peptide ABC transporter, ATP-binding protein [Rhizobium tropici CIAT 899]MBB4240700.1 peptide/nickel transport system ATP-binding protein [Rhizobium tropici]MBB5591883.1 peptide/nickel transport system ATP-binding protein [Rhizobium tropici]MBB6490937.1 peptide/nickel transport system ATP-binding protein [Rhizobium tropici]NEV12595.1 ABC transporter ATP-binding protein [Rhizobium tropici]